MKWIDINDTMPAEDEWILVGSADFQEVSFGMCLDGQFYNPDIDYHNIRGVTHWMQMPKPPKWEK